MEKALDSAGEREMDTKQITMVRDWIQPLEYSFPALRLSHKNTGGHISDTKRASRDPLLTKRVLNVKQMDFRIWDFRISDMKRASRDPLLTKQVLYVKQIDFRIWDFWIWDNKKINQPKKTTKTNQDRPRPTKTNQDQTKQKNKPLSFQSCLSLPSYKLKFLWCF